MSYTTHSDNDLFYLYWSIIEDIDDLESREYYEWQVDEYFLDQARIQELCDDLDSIEKEAGRRGLSLNWEDRFTI